MVIRVFAGFWMAWEDLRGSTQSVLDASELKEDEETLGSQFWDNQSIRCAKVCTDVNQLLYSTTNTSLIPPVQVLIFIGGVLGNRNTTGKLHRSNTMQTDCENLLNTVLKYSSTSTVRDLLLSQPHPSSQPRTENLALQFLRICIAQIARSPAHDHEEPLNYRPFFRDALLWMSEQLDYPEMAGEEFISVLQPLGLRLCSDYRPQIQLVGLKLLEELAHKARVADWRQSNRAEAVITQLFDHRLGCHPGSSELVLHKVYGTIFALIRLLESSKTHVWWNKVADRLLCDIVMEGKKSRLTVLLRHTQTVMEVMKTEFVSHSRRFLHAVSVVLLGPRTPDYLRKTLPDDAQDQTVHFLMLECVLYFIRFNWPVISSLLPLLIPPLVAFADLEHTQASSCTTQDAQCTAKLSEILTTLVALEPRVMTDILIPACTAVPTLKQYLPVSCK